MEQSDQKEPRGYCSGATVIEIEQDPTLVKDHILWSIFSFHYLNCCCLGFIALWYSIKSRDQKHAKNLTLAREFGLTAKRLNIVTTVLTIITYVIVIAIYAATIITMISQLKQRN
ncbi:IFM10 protein, partial [Polypterus senegalus]